MIIFYHGCRQEDLAKLIAGQIDVSLGGGELDRGFYTTLSFYTAKEWAWHKYKSLSSSITVNNLTKTTVNEQENCPR